MSEASDEVCWGAAWSLPGSGGIWRDLEGPGESGGTWWDLVGRHLAEAGQSETLVLPVCDSPGLSIHLSASVQLLEAFNARS